MGEYAKALPLHEEGLAIRRKVLGREHPDTVMSLGNLACLYESRGDHSQGHFAPGRGPGNQYESPGREPPRLCLGLNNLARLY